MQVPKDTIELTADGIWRGIRKLSGLALFVIPFGMAFGVAAIERGLSITQAATMSALVFSGAAQFASLDLWSSASALSLMLVALAVSARHILLGASLSPWINKLGRRRRLPALAMLSDPNFADSFNAFQKGERDIGRLVGGGLVLWAAWVAGTLLGAVAGEQFADLERFGIDVLMPCYFAALVIAHWRNEWAGLMTVLPALAAGSVAISGTFLLPAGWAVVAAALAGGAVAGLMHGR